MIHQMHFLNVVKLFITINTHVDSKIFSIFFVGFV